MLWVKFQRPYPESQVSSRYALDCPGYRMMLLQTNETGWDGDAIGGSTIHERDRRWSGIVPDTLGEDILNEACEYWASSVRPPSP